MVAVDDLIVLSKVLQAYRTFEGGVAERLACLTSVQLCGLAENLRRLAREAASFEQVIERVRAGLQ